MSTPATTVYLCKNVDCRSDYQHTYMFADLAAQSAFFDSKVNRTLSKYMYLRKNWDLRVEIPYSEAQYFSYLFFVNPGTTKRYYYFIKNHQYINDNTTELSLEMDVMQTYLFDYDFLPTFIEREHVSDDTPGANLIPENLDLGELVNIGYQKISSAEMMLVIASTVRLDSSEYTPAPGFVYNGVYSGLLYYACDMNIAAEMMYILMNGDGANIPGLNNVGKSEAIVSLWVYPKKFLNMAKVDNGLNLYVISGGAIEELTVYNPVDLVDYGGYNPRNKKLLTYPYRFMYCSNNLGGFAQYHYEKFNGDPTFSVVGTAMPDGGLKIVPTNYKGIVTNYEEGLSLGGFPTCAWDQDYYKIWLAQNQNTQNLSIGTGALTAVAGVATAVAGAFTYNPALIGMGLTTAVSGGTKIASVLAQREDVEVQPPQAKGSQSASINVSTGNQTFTIYHKSIDDYHSEIIDDYFDMFGYRVNRVAIPNRRSRTKWNHLKTVNCLIHTINDICNEDVVKIQSIYDSGITFWHHDNIGSYSRDNTIR